jgi:phosphoglycerol transferase
MESDSREDRAMIGSRSTRLETTGDVPTVDRSRLRGAQIALGQALLITASLYFLVQGWNRDIRVPLSFSGDSLVYLMQSKSTVDNGWWWFNPMVGAPFGLDELAFPSNSNVDQAIVWGVSRFVRNAPAAVTLAWMLMVVLSGLSATWCLRRLGVSTASSIVGGTLFALSPYALYRNIDHFSLVIYLVPFACTAGLLLASGQPPERWFWKGCGGLLAGCALLGFNYVYYAFFACFCIGIAAIVGWLAHRDPRILRAGGFCVVLIASSTLINLAPSLYSWGRHGTPMIVRQKVPAESEVYGLKIRQLIGPLRHHRFPPFSKWAEKEAAARFPLETENGTSRLGLVGSLGFLGLLALLFVPEADHLNHGRTVRAASRLTLAAVLLSTIGGFGSLFSLLISSDIRAYNRICPFIAFFSLVAVALAIDSLFKTRERRTMAAVIVLALGLSDQGTAAVNLNVAYPGIAAEIRPLETFVHQLESRLPDQSMVLELPFRTYLDDEGVARMMPYDHLKLYVVSHSIRWSYPALSNDQVLWQQALASLDPRRLAGDVAAAGFAAVLIDRNGYEDNGASVAADIGAGLSADNMIAQTDRYMALDIRSLAGGAAETRFSGRPMPATRAMSACSGQTVMYIDQIGDATSPFSDNPHMRRSGLFKVMGWAVDQPREAAAAGVDVVVDQIPFPSFYGYNRTDVADHFKRPGYRASGFTAAIPADALTRGPHTLSLRVISSDATCYYRTPDISIIVD